MLPNNGILFNGVLRFKPGNIPFGFFSSINNNFLLLCTAQFDNIIVVSFLVFNSFDFTFCVIFFFFLTSNKILTCFIMAYVQNINNLGLIFV